MTVVLKPGKVEVPRYAAMHIRLQRFRKFQCSQCAVEHPRTQMALIHGRPYVVEVGGQNAGRRYSTDIENYKELCPSCHNRYDRTVANLLHGGN